ncbi:MAG: hypothetical protein WCP86_05455 [bacterium]
MALCQQGSARRRSAEIAVLGRKQADKAGPIVSGQSVRGWTSFGIHCGDMTHKTDSFICDPIVVPGQKDIYAGLKTFHFSIT